MLNISRQLFSFSRTYSKYQITRSPKESYITYYPNDFTVDEVLTAIRKDCPQSQFYAASAFNLTLLNTPVPKEAIESTESIKNESFIALLLGG